MGATNFAVEVEATDARTAFRLAVDQAYYEHGHGGYSGSIAEKREFKMVMLQGTGPYTKSGSLRKNGPSKKWTEHLDRLEDANDKWGPALCVELCKGRYYFFGLVSC